MSSLRDVRFNGSIPMNHTSQHAHAQAPKTDMCENTSNLNPQPNSIPSPSPLYGTSEMVLRHIIFPLMPQHPGL